MDSFRSTEQKLVWSFWVAAALAAVGGLLPVVFGGTSSRFAGEFVPFVIAALAFAGCALLHNQGRAVNAGLYFLAGLALVYGVLSMAALPLELAALGTCPAAPAPCTDGLPRALSSGENTGMGFASGFAFVSLFVGFLGLMIVFRRATTKVAAPRERTIAPVVKQRPAPSPAPVAVGVGAAVASENGSGPGAHAEELDELPAHEEPDLPELPPHESEPPTT